MFSHYWSTLTAEVLARLPRERRSIRTNDLAKVIFEANITDYGADGPATCAYVSPSNVGGRSIHQVDPLVNDQDRYFNIWIRMTAEEGLSAL